MMLEDIAKCAAIKAAQGKKELSAFFWIWLMDGKQVDFDRFKGKVKSYNIFKQSLQ